MFDKKLQQKTTVAENAAKATGNTVDYGKIEPIMGTSKQKYKDIENYTDEDIDNKTSELEASIKERSKNNLTFYPMLFKTTEDKVVDNIKKDILFLENEQKRRKTERCLLISTSRRLRKNRKTRCI